MTAMVWIVLRTGGWYEDAVTIPLAAFTTEEAAEAHVARLKEQESVKRPIDQDQFHVSDPIEVDQR